MKNRIHQFFALVIAVLFSATPVYATPPVAVDRQQDQRPAVAALNQSASQQAPAQNDPAAKFENQGAVVQVSAGVIGTGQLFLVQPTQPHSFPVYPEDSVLDAKCKVSGNACRTNSDGRFVLEIYQRGKISESYIYQRQGGTNLLNEATEYSRSGSKITTTYRLDVTIVNGQQITRLIPSTVTFFDAKGNSTHRDFLSSQGSIQKTETYLKDGKIDGVIYYNPETKQQTKRENYTYDPKTNRLKEILIYTGNPANVLTSKKTFSYDASGNLASEQIFNRVKVGRRFEWQVVSEKTFKYENGLKIYSKMTENGTITEEYFSASSVVFARVIQEPGKSAVLAMYVGGVSMTSTSQNGGAKEVSLSVSVSENLLPSQMMRILSGEAQVDESQWGQSGTFQKEDGTYGVNYSFLMENTAYGYRVQIFDSRLIGHENLVVSEVAGSFKTVTPTPIMVIDSEMNLTASEGSPVKLLAPFEITANGSLNVTTPAGLVRITGLKMEGQGTLTIDAAGNVTIVSTQQIWWNGFEGSSYPGSFTISINFDGGLGYSNLSGGSAINVYSTGTIDNGSSSIGGLVGAGTTGSSSYSKEIVATSVNKNAVNGIATKTITSVSLQPLQLKPLSTVAVPLQGASQSGNSVAASMQVVSAVTKAKK